CAGKARAEPGCTETINIRRTPPLLRETRLAVSCFAASRRPFGTHPGVSGALSTESGHGSERSLRQRRRPRGLRRAAAHAPAAAQRQARPAAVAAQGALSERDGRRGAARGYGGRAEGGPRGARGAGRQAEGGRGGARGAGRQAEGGRGGTHGADRQAEGGRGGAGGAGRQAEGLLRRREELRRLEDRRRRRPAAQARGRAGPAGPRGGESGPRRRLAAYPRSAARSARARQLTPRPSNEDRERRVARRVTSRLPAPSSARRAPVWWAPGLRSRGPTTARRP